MLGLNKERLFLLLGPTVTQSEKDAMWSRVEHMKLEIMNAENSATHGGLTIVDDFSNYRVSDLDGANLVNRNIFTIFRFKSEWPGYDSKTGEKEDIPHRLNAEEVRLDLVATSTRKYQSGAEKATYFALDLYSKYMKESSRGLNNVFRSDERLRSFLETIYKSSKESNKTTGSLFDKVSTIVKYGDQLPGQERMDLFSNEFARSHGVNNILDVFYIDGRPAREVLPQIDDIIRRIEASEQALAILAADRQKEVSGKAVPAKKAAVSNEEKLAFRDMVAKAYLQACIISGKNQVTIANYQKNAKGEDELVITDLNAIVRGDHDMPLERRYCNR